MIARLKQHGLGFVLAGTLSWNVAGLALGQAAPPAASATSTPERFDASTGAMGRADQARGWDETPGVEDEDVALFVPRGILLVPKLALKAVFWLPLEGSKLVDRYHLVEYAEQILYFDEAHNIGWRPDASYHTDYGLTSGVKLFHKSLFGHNESLSARALFAGRYTQAYQLAFSADRTGGSRMWLEVRARYEDARALLFGGIGVVERSATGSSLNPRDSNELTYFGQERAHGMIRAGYTAGERGALAKLGGTLLFNHRAFNRNSLDERQLSDVYDTSLLPGYDRAVNTLEMQANMVFDLRENHGLDMRGTYLEGFFGGVPPTAHYAYLHYGVEIAHTIDLYRATRLLRFRVAFEAVEGDTERIPFTDLPWIGGSRRLRGYREAQFRDMRASFASVEYHYPIHRAVRGELFIDTGYVAKQYEDLVKLDHWKLGYGAGIVIGSESDLAVQLSVAYGKDLRVYLSTDLTQAFEGADQL